MTMIKSGFSRTFVRSITIQQPSTTVISEPVPLGIANEASPIIDSIDVSDIKTPTFKTVGSPASTLSVTTPPSVPVHVKKGSVMSIYSYSQKESEKSQNNTFIKSTWEFTQPIRRMLLASDVSTYQKIIGTVPLEILVSAYRAGSSRTASVMSFVNLPLDGSYDWALFQTNSLQCYTGNSLNISIKSLPKKLHDGFTNRAYTLLNGRGLASVVGKGNVFKVGLGAGEEIRVNRKNLFAVSIKDSAELNDESNFTTEVWDSMNGLFQGVKHDNRMEPEPKTINIFNNPSVDTIITKIYQLSKSLISYAYTTKSHITDYVIGNGNYVLVKGPRTVLIETGSGNDKFVVNQFQNADGVAALEKFITKQDEWKKPKVEVGDNLGIVSISNGKTTYRNVPNFDEEAKRIESLKKH